MADARDSDLALDTVEEAIAAFARGEMVVVVDDADRENEGDLIMAAEAASESALAFMIRHTSGIVCAPIEGEQARQLELEPMVARNDAPLATAFTVSVDHKPGLNTGISAAERAACCRALADPKSRAQDFVRPGHVFPLIARPGGVLMRSGHTEAATDLARLAGLQPAGVIAELVNDDGTVKRLPDLVPFAREHGLKIVAIADLIHYRQRAEKLVERVQDRWLSHPGGGSLRCLTYRTVFDATLHYAFLVGEPSGVETVPTRVQRENPLVDLFGLGRSGEDVAFATVLQRLVQEGKGLAVCLRTDPGQPALPADATDAAGLGSAPEAGTTSGEWRDIGLGAQILLDLGIRHIELLTKSDRRYVALDGYGIEIMATRHLQPDR